MSEYFTEHGKDELVRMVKRFMDNEYIDDVFYEKHVLVDDRVNIPKSFILSYFKQKEKDALRSGGT